MPARPANLYSAALSNSRPGTLSTGSGEDGAAQAEWLAAAAVRNGVFDWADDAVYKYGLELFGSTSTSASALVEVSK